VSLNKQELWQADIMTPVTAPAAVPAVPLGWQEDSTLMGTFAFTSNPEPTIGVELELGLVDRTSWQLANRVNEVLELIPESLADVYKPELMQGCIEVITGVCSQVGDVREDLTDKLRILQEITDSLGLGLWWGSTHPFSSWRDQQITPNERYKMLVDLLQEMARRLVTFGLHVHVAVNSGDKAVMICDRMMQHLPTLLALSSSSPYWEGRDTGLCSHRSKIMEGLPTAGLPSMMRNWSEYVWLVNHLVDTGFIHTIREIWWDIRPHHKFGTVEVRICDMPGNLDDTLAIAALVQCLVQALSDDIDQGTYQHDCHPMMVRQNKWRACRFGNKAQLVNSYTYEVQSVKDITDWLVDRLLPISQSLGCEAELLEVREMARRPSWADLQRKILAQTEQPEEIVKQLTEQARVE
jgi:carboxylate-amine ligase